MLQGLCWRNVGPDGTGCVVITVTLGLVAEAGTTALTVLTNPAIKHSTSLLGLGGWEWGTLLLRSRISVC